MNDLIIPSCAELDALREHTINNAAWKKEDLEAMCENLMKSVEHYELHPSKNSQEVITSVGIELAKILRRLEWLAERENTELIQEISSRIA
jgi:hypothetical protein